MSELPTGWKKRKEGFLEYTMLPYEVEEMKKKRRMTFMLIATNIIQSLFLIILMISHFCSHQ